MMALTSAFIEIGARYADTVIENRPININRAMGMGITLAASIYSLEYFFGDQVASVFLLGQLIYVVPRRIWNLHNQRSLLQEINRIGSLLPEIEKIKSQLLIKPSQLLESPPAA
jgi:hypothetical protein